MKEEIRKIKALTTQILKNQEHILYELGAMHSSGRIHTSIYSRDKVSEVLRKDSFDLRKDIEPQENDKD